MANPGERVADVTCSNDKLIVDLEDGRTISVPLAWYPRPGCPTHLSREIHVTTSCDV